MLIKRIEKIADSIILAIVTAASSAMIAVVFAQVFCRYVLNDPLSWSEECARYCFVYIAFCGGAWAGKEYAHLGVDYLVSKLPARAQDAVELLIDAAVGLFSVLIVAVALITIPKLSGQLSPAMRIPMYYPYSAIPIGFAFLAFYYALHFVEHLRKIRYGSDALTAEEREAIGC